MKGASKAINRAVRAARLAQAVLDGGATREEAVEAIIVRWPDAMHLGTQGVSLDPYVTVTRVAPASYGPIVSVGDSRVYVDDTYVRTRFGYLASVGHKPRGWGSR